MFARRSRIVAVALLAATACALSAAAFAARPKKAPRAATSVTKATYVILRGEEQAGQERVSRTVYNDNTIAFDVDYVFSPAPEIEMHNQCELLVREESFFPIEFHMDRVVSQQDNTMEMSVDIEMFANVAEFTTGTANATTTRHIVVPTGSAVIETGLVFVYEPLLFWYDRDAGGRQNFDILEASSGRPLTVSMHYVTRDTVTVGGEEYATDLFLVERDQFDVSVFVDDMQRIVRVDQNYMKFDLVEWTREGGE